MHDWQNLILVKENGKRFSNELDSSYDGFFAHAMAWTGDPAKLNGGGSIWAIFDAEGLKREKWSTEQGVVDRERGYFFSGDTLEELAAQLKKNPYQWRPMPARRFAKPSSASTRSSTLTPTSSAHAAPQNRDTAFYAAWAAPSLHGAAGLRTNTRC